MDKRERMRIISELGDIIQFNWERRISNPEELLNDFLKHPNIAIVERNGNNIRELAPMLNSEGNIGSMDKKHQWLSIETKRGINTTTVMQLNHYNCFVYLLKYGITNKNNSIGGL
jgi:hypothetical protein